jgi:hypothetical protein
LPVGFHSITLLVRCGEVASIILKLGIRCGLVVYFTYRPLLFPGKEPHSH